MGNDAPPLENLRTLETSPTPKTLRIGLFGTLTIHAEGVALNAGLARKEGWLLALLALRPDRATPRDFLAGLLWPECDEAQALYNLRRSLTRLRDALGHHADCIQQIRPRSLGFDATRASVDALEFDRLIVSDDPRMLAEAVRLCQGPLLQTCYEEWAQAERLPRELAYQQALEKLARGALERGEWHDAEKYCRLHIASDPLQEQAHRLLMQACAQSGNQAAAMQAYRDLRVRLREEINADPDPQTVACYEAIRQEAMRQEALQHKAKASTPVPAQSAPPPAASSPVAFAAPLPQPLTRLIGRDLEVPEVCGYLAQSRLVTLLGAGGVGKTRLAIEIAHRFSTRMADGAAFVELAGLADDALPVRALARTLGIAEVPNAPLLTTLTEHLHTQERLIVLDNCEHLRSSCAHLASALLTTCPRLRILATSRQALGLPGETVWRVPSLPVPPVFAGEALMSEAKSDDTLEYAATQLFLERVSQICPEFRLSPAMLSPIGQICRRLDGIPLAIELAAYRVRSLSPEKIASRLTDRFHLLTGGGTASLPRQQTLRALIDWSYRLLDPDEQLLLARLSVFAGGWTLEAAEHICIGEGAEAWEVLDLLSSLIDKSLVMYEPRSEGSRYRFLESIREYARERLEASGEAAEYRQRHAAYYADLAVDTEPRLIGPEQGALQEQLEQEHDNLRTALTWGRENEAGAITALRIVSRLWRFWMQRGYWQEGREQLRHVLDAPQSRPDSELRSRACNGAGMLAYRMGDFAQARLFLEDSLAVARRRQDKRGIAVALGNLGHVPAAQGQFAEAREMYGEALALSREQGNESGAAYSLIGLGNVAASLGELPTAQQQYEEALTLFRRLGDTGGELLILGNLGWVALTQKDGPLAKTRTEQALALCRQLKRTEGEALYLPNLGAACELAGDMAGAWECYRQALQVSLQLGDKRTLAATLETLAAYYLRTGEYAQAARYYGCTDTGYTAIAMSRSTLETANREEAFATLRDRMGEDAFTVCFAEGQKLSLEELAHEAVSESIS